MTRRSVLLRSLLFLAVIDHDRVDRAACAGGA